MRRRTILPLGESSLVLHWSSLSGSRSTCGLTAWHRAATVHQSFVEGKKAWKHRGSNSESRCMWVMLFARGLNVKVMRATYLTEVCIASTGDGSIREHLNNDSQESNYCCKWLISILQSALSCVSSSIAILRSRECRFMLVYTRSLLHPLDSGLFFGMWNAANLLIRSPAKLL